MPSARWRSKRKPPPKSRERERSKRPELPKRREPKFSQNSVSRRNFLRACAAWLPAVPPATWAQTLWSQAPSPVQSSAGRRFFAGWGTLSSHFLAASPVSAFDPISGSASGITWTHTSGRSPMVCCSDATARRIWQTVNLVNLQENVLPTRERAHLVLEKGRDHAVRRVRLRMV